MPRIATLDLSQINRQIDIMDNLQNQFLDLQQKVANIGQTTNIADPIHAPSTTNNLIFTWTGSTGVLSWPQAFIKDKNWNTQTVSRPAKISSAPGQQHVYNVGAGNTVLSPNTYYWLGWDHGHQQMVAVTDVSSIHGNFNAHVICKIYTGTSGQTGVAGGGGSTGGVDLSGLTYKNF
jgi:hypothetical protein